MRAISSRGTRYGSKASINMLLSVYVVHLLALFNYHVWHNYTFVSSYVGLKTILILIFFDPLYSHIFTFFDHFNLTVKNLG